MIKHHGGSKMSKNRNYRDYSYKKKPVEAIEELPVEETQEVSEEAIEKLPEETQEVNLNYTNKEEIDTKGLGANTFAEEYPKGKISCDKLRVRTSPAVEPNNILGLYLKGTEVAILKDMGEWLSVEIEKNSVTVRGFVMAEFIER